jgi:hypothetical protein
MGLLIIVLRFQFSFEKVLIGDLVVSSISAASLALIVLGFAWKVKPMYVHHG